MAMFLKIFSRAAGLGLMAWGLGGCGAGSGDLAGTMMVAPGRYEIYDCVQLDASIRSTRIRITDLEQLMARAAKGPGGDFVNAVTYRSEYEQARAQYKDMVLTAGNKNCPAQSKWSSERSVF